MQYRAYQKQLIKEVHKFDTIKRLIKIRKKENIYEGYFDKAQGAENE